MLHVHLRIDHTTIQCAIRTERIRGEYDFIRNVISNHHFRPMHHRSHIKYKLMTTRIQGITLFHLKQEMCIRDSPEYKDLGNTGAKLADEIMTHRRIELWGEGFSWFDLKSCV